MISKWFLPAEIAPELRVILLCLLSIALLTACRLAWRPAGSGASAVTILRELLAAPMSRILLLFVMVYLLTLLVSVSCFDALTPFDHRILSPVLVACIPLLVLAADRARRHCRPPFTRLPGLLLLLLLLVTASRATVFLAAVHRDGLGFTARIWRESPLMAAVAALPPPVRVISNAPDIIYLLLNRPATMLPASYAPKDGVIIPHWQAALAAAAADSRPVRVALFDRVTWRTYLPTTAMLAATGLLSETVSYADGTVAVLRPASAVTPS